MRYRKRYRSDIAKEAAIEGSGPPRLGALVMKAVRSLPAAEQEEILPHLLGALLERSPVSQPASETGDEPASWLEVNNALIVLRALREGAGVAEAAATVGLAPDAARGALAAFSTWAVKHCLTTQTEAHLVRSLSTGKGLEAVGEKLGVGRAGAAALLGGVIERGTMALTKQSAHRGHGLGPSVELRLLETIRATGGAPGIGQQMVPVRLSEAQHQRLKDWCAEHGFKMAVVIRGLVERFLDDQSRRAS